MTVRVLAAAGALTLALGAPSAVRGARGASVGPMGARAFEAARQAAEAAATAAEEGRGLLARLRSHLSGGPTLDARRELEDEAMAAERALEGYRAQAQASADEAVRVLSEAPRGAEAADRVRRELAEQRALLAGREAQVMAARARAETERIRAVLAEARLLLATLGAGAAPRAAPSPAGGQRGTPPAREVGPGVEVPNVVGARLEGARADLQDAGLRVGGIDGAHEGYVVRQSPEAGEHVAPGTSVRLILSSTAATVREAAP